MSASTSPNAASVCSLASHGNANSLPAEGTHSFDFAQVKHAKSSNAGKASAAGNSVTIPCNITLSVASADWISQLSRCLNKLMDKMDAQRSQLLELSSQLHPIIFNEVASCSILNSGSLADDTLGPQSVSNCTFSLDSVNSNDRVDSSGVYKERIQYLQNVFNQQWSELESLKRCCDESHSRMNPLKGNHSMAGNLQSPTTGQVESNCGETEASTFAAAYQPSTLTSTCCTSSTTSQLISSISQAIHTVESSSSPSSPPFYRSSVASSSSSSSSSPSSSCFSSSPTAPTTTYTITGTNYTGLNRETLPHGEKSQLAHAKNRSFLSTSTYSKSEESTDSRDSGINSELSS